MKPVNVLSRFVRRAIIWIYRRQTQRILARSRAQTGYYDNDPTFFQLYNSYPPHDSYKYDALSLWERASKRFLYLLEETQLADLNKAHILDVGGGDGTLGYLFQCFGFDAFLVDIEDWRAKWAKNTPLLHSNLEGPLDFESDFFDLVVSYNTFEHLSNPQIAWNEMLRVCRPGGYLYLSFGPLYASAWGLHAYKTVGIPYLQYLFSTPYVMNKLKLVGIRDLGKACQELQPLNKWRVSDFRSLWHVPECEIIKELFAENYDHLSIVLRYPKSFQGRGLTVADLATSNIYVFIRKK